MDEKYLFNVNQTIKNNTNKTYSFYPYGQIIRTELPDTIDFFILHEGYIGVFDDQLVEKDYDDVIDKKYSINSDKGFLGITDKYWLASLIPEKGKKFRADFEYDKKFKANFIETEALELKPNSEMTNEIKVIVAAKEVRSIEGYMESLDISKFDLVIDFGWFYWLVKGVWYLCDYFYKLTGNYGVATP